MIDLVTRQRRAVAPFRMPSWQDIPLELFVSAAGLLLAAGLKILGVMP
ncbi:MAG: hypothetical protein PGN25_18965 [Methylorubrum populi]